jgi:hypothetical protein
MTNFLKFGFEFALTGGTTARQIIAMLDPKIEIQAAHIQAVRELCEKGETYSGEKGDVLGSAWQCAANGKTDTAPYEAGWVALMLSNASAGA